MADLVLLLKLYKKDSFCLQPSNTWLFYTSSTNRNPFVFCTSELGFHREQYLQHEDEENHCYVDIFLSLLYNFDNSAQVSFHPFLFMFHSVMLQPAKNQSPHGYLIILLD